MLLIQEIDMRKTSACAALVAAVSTAGSVAWAATPLFDYTEISTPGGSMYMPYDMNQYGDVAGDVYLQVTSQGTTQQVRVPFRYYNGSFETLARDPANAFHRGTARSINNAGLVGGQVALGTWGDDTPVLWTSANSYALLPVPATSTPDPRAVKITDLKNGKMYIAMESYVNNTQSYILALDNALSVVENHVIRVPNGRTTQLWDINSSGTYIGRGDVSTTEYIADGFMAALPQKDIAAADTFRVYAGFGAALNAINENNDVVGNTAWGPADIYKNPYWRAFLRKADGTVIDLGLGGGVRASAAAINDNGQIVGSWLDASFKGTACLFRAGKTAVDLNTLVTVPTGYKIVDAVNINNAGQILAKVQQGTNSNATFIWRLNPISAATHMANIGHFDDGTLTGWTITTSGFSDAWNSFDPIIPIEDLEGDTTGFNRVMALMTGSPVLASTLINTPAQSFTFSMKYYVDESTGLLSVTLDGTTIGAIDCAAVPAGTWLNASFAVTNPALQGLLGADLGIEYNAADAFRTAYVDDLAVQVPEPAMLGAALISATLLLRRRR